MVEFSGYARSDVDHFRSCFPGITGTYAPDAIVGRIEPGHERQGRGRARPGGGDGRGARRRAARIRRPQRPQLRARDLRPDAPGRGRHHQRQLGRLRAADHARGCCRPRTRRSSWRPWPASRRSWPRATSDRPTASRSRAPPTCSSTTPRRSRLRPPSAARRSRCRRCTEARRETAWHGSGGGISMHWRKPVYQLGKTVERCAAASAAAARRSAARPPTSRSTRAPNAAGTSSTATAAAPGRGVVWAPIGGTSAAAPLMAALTADADESAGKQLGFANPFLYAQAGTSVFRDIDSGHEQPVRRQPATPPTPGYDLATGLGSIRAGAFATALAAYAPECGVGRLHRPRTSPARSTAAGSRTGAGSPSAGRSPTRPRRSPSQTRPCWSSPTWRRSASARTPPAGGRCRARRPSCATSAGTPSTSAPTPRRPQRRGTRRIYVTPHLGLTVQLPFRSGHYVATSGHRRSRSSAAPGR